MFKAGLETRHFSFEAYGETKESAKAAIEAGLLAHAKHYRLAPDWWRDDENDITFDELHVGMCMRDGEILSCAPSSTDDAAPAP